MRVNACAQQQPMVGRLVMQTCGTAHHDAALMGVLACACWLAVIWQHDAQILGRVPDLRGVHPGHVHCRLRRCILILRSSIEWRSAHLPC